jgi:hypothetical protein
MEKLFEAELPTNTIKEYSFVTAFASSSHVNTRMGWAAPLSPPVGAMV